MLSPSCRLLAFALLLLMALPVFGQVRVVGKGVRPAQPTTQSMRENYARNRDSMLTGVPNLGEADWAELFDVEGGEKDTRVIPRGKAVGKRALVFTPRGDTLPVRIDMYPIGDGSNSFSAQRIELDPPGLVVRATSVSCYAGQSLSGSVMRLLPSGQSENVNFSVMLGANRSFQVGGGGQVQFNHYSSLGRSSGSLSAASVSDLRVRAPAEFDEHVRPMLWLMVGGRLLAPSRSVAMQVLPESAELDGPKGQRISRAVASLSSDDLAASRDAQAVLAAYGVETWVWLQSNRPKAMTPEQLIQVDRLREEVDAVPADTIKRMAGDKDFLLDACLSSDPAIVSAARARVEKLTGRKMEGTGSGQVAAYRASVNQKPTTKPREPAQ